MMNTDKAAQSHNGITANASKFEIETLDLDRHWPGINRLLEMEEWPFIKADLEVSDEQERSIGLIVRYGSEIKGFFTIHHFGDIGYLDMVVIEPSERRNVLMANELWRRAKAEMEKNGFTSKVAHCTRSSARMLRLIGYKPGIKFKLMRKDEYSTNGAEASIPYLDKSALPDLISLDQKVFGMSRQSWLESLIAQKTSKFVGRYLTGELAASACLRERRENSLCIDSCNSLSADALFPLMDDILSAFPHKRLECFVKSDSDLYHYLVRNGFYIPDFFAEIGPLVELRIGDADDVGTGPNVRTLSWI